MAKSRLLVALALLALAAPSLAWQKEVADMLRWMDWYGYSTFSKALRDTGLDQTMVKLLDQGHTLTLLAPTNAAFSAYNGPECCIPVDTVLSLHILDGTYTAATILSDQSPLYPTGTAVPVAKKKNKPLRLGVETGFLQWLSTTKVIAGDAYKTRYLLVHGVDAVLQYPCYGKFCS